MKEMCTCSHVQPLSISFTKTLVLVTSCYFVTIGRQKKKPSLTATAVSCTYIIKIVIVSYIKTTLLTPLTEAGLERGERERGGGEGYVDLLDLLELRILSLIFK